MKDKQEGESSPEFNKKNRQEWKSTAVINFLKLTKKKLQTTEPKEFSEPVYSFDLLN